MAPRYLACMGRARIKVPITLVRLKQEQPHSHNNRKVNVSVAKVSLCRQKKITYWRKLAANGFSRRRFFADDFPAPVSVALLQIRDNCRFEADAQLVKHSET